MHGVPKEIYTSKRGEKKEIFVQEMVNSGYLRLYIVPLCVPLREHTRAISGTRSAGWPPLSYTEMYASIGHNNDRDCRSQRITISY